jgi:hypothetical protein
MFSAGRWYAATYAAAAAAELVSSAPFSWQGKGFRSWQGLMHTGLNGLDCSTVQPCSMSSSSSSSSSMLIVLAYMSSQHQ